MSLIFVDVEAGFDSPCPGVGETGMTEFGAVEFKSRLIFHGFPAELVPIYRGPYLLPDWSPWVKTFKSFDEWLNQFPKPYIFVSDNPAYDWQWINYHFHNILKRNPFGHSARRIGDYYAGLRNNFHRSSEWKKLRITKHDHNPVNDAMGNVEAFERLLKGERV
jgi:hypothetical protein